MVIFFHIMNKYNLEKNSICQDNTYRIRNFGFHVATQIKIHYFYTYKTSVGMLECLSEQSVEELLMHRNCQAWR